MDKLLDSHVQDLILVHVPSHAGIFLQEQVDEAAGRAANALIPIAQCSSPNFLLRQLRDQLQTSWLQNFLAEE
eukprot:345038-Amphidinium_carterae.1